MVQSRRKRQVCWRNRRRNHQPLRSRRWCSPDAYRLDTVGFSCAPAGFGQPSILPFKLLLFGRGGTDESGGPALFEPSLQVERDIGHVKPLHFAPVQSGSADLQLWLDNCIDLRQALVAVRSLPPRSRSGSANKLKFALELKKARARKPAPLFSWCKFAALFVAHGPSLRVIGFRVTPGLA